MARKSFRSVLIIYFETKGIVKDLTVRRIQEYKKNYYRVSLQLNGEYIVRYYSGEQLERLRLSMKKPS